MSEQNLAGKAALITVGARGLGRGYALRLAGLGADIAIIDRNLKAADVYEFEKELMTADSVMAECQALGVRTKGLEVDLTERAATEKSMAEISAELGSIDIAVSNAGGGTAVFADERDASTGANDTQDLVTTGLPSDTSEEMLTRVLDINVKTCMNTCMPVAPYMKKQGGGCKLPLLV